MSDQSDALNQLDRLNVGIDDLRSEVEQERLAREAETEAREKEQKASERATTRAYIAIGLALVVALIAVVFGVQANNAAQTAQEAVDAVVAARTEAREAACAQDNIRIAQHNALSEAVRGVVVLAAGPNPDRTPEQQAKADEFLASSNSLIDSTLVDERDCSTTGIDAYYSTKDK